MKRYRNDWLFLLLVILGGLLLRLDFLVASDWVIDSDEAIVGLMAKHIAEGAPWPTFYYGQHYMGSFEALLVALVFKLFGLSLIGLKLVPLLFSLWMIVLVYDLAFEFGGRRAARIAALLCAFPPAPLVIWSAKARGGFVEIVVIGTAALLLTTRWLRRDTARLRDTALIAVLLGFGWWINNQIIYFMLPIGFVMFARLFRESVALYLRLQLIVRHAAVGIGCFLIGGLPFWCYNIRHDFASFGMFAAARAEDLGAHVAGFFTDAIPILLGAKRFWERNNFYPYSTTMIYIIYTAGCLIFLYYRRARIAALMRLRIDRHDPIELLLLCCLSTACVFVLSSFGELFVAPRYLLPLYPVLFVLIAYGTAKLPLRRPNLGSAFVAAICVFNLASSYSGGRSVPGEPFVHENDRVQRDHRPLITWLAERGINWVRTNYWIGYRLAFETREQVRFLIYQKPSQVRIQSYEDDGAGAAPDRMPMIVTASQVPYVAKSLDILGYRHEHSVVGGYHVIHQIAPLYSDLRPVSPDHFELHATDRPADLGFLTDRNLSTRWGTGRPQRSGMQIVADFPEPVRLRGIKYDLGHWITDYPRGLTIEVETAERKNTVLLKSQRYSALRAFMEGNSVFSLYRDAGLVRKVTITQSGDDPVFDWSIAELAFME